jgi:hypothetical protein
MAGKLDEVKFDKPPYSSRYPGLSVMPSDNPGLPKGNFIGRNIVIRCSDWLQVDPKAAPVLKHERNLIDVDPRFVNSARGDYRLRPDSPAFRLGFHSLPIDEFGPKTKAKS